MYAFWVVIEMLSVVGLILGLVLWFSKKFKENTDLKKKGQYLAIASVVVLFASGFIITGITNSRSQQTKIDKKVVTYQALSKDIEKLSKKKDDLTDDVNQLSSDKTSLNNQITDLQNKNKDVMTAIKNKKQLNDQVVEAKDNLSSAKSDISDAKDQLNSLNRKIDSAKTALAQAKGEVTKAKSAPKTLGAGKYTVGNDIKAGRYKVTPVGQGSNFFVYGDGDETDVIVNTILGSDGEPSYTFETSDGDVIQTEATVKLTPIE
jgi:septal ring factor EnvC (AmiA/AmiB activator)